MEGSRVPQTFDDLVFRAAQLVVSDDVLSHDRQVAACVLVHTGALARGAFLALPRTRRARARAITSALSMTPLTVAPERRPPWPAPFSHIAFDVASATLEDPSSRRINAAQICASLACIVAPTPARCRRIARAAARALQEPLETDALGVLLSWAGDAGAYGALVELAARCIAVPDSQGTALMVLCALRRAPRCALPLAWFLETADEEAARGPMVIRARRVRDLLSGLIGPDGHEPPAVVAWRKRHVGFLAIAGGRMPPIWPRQEVFGG